MIWKHLLYFAYVILQTSNILCGLVQGKVYAYTCILWFLEMSEVPVFGADFRVQVLGSIMSCFGSEFCIFKKNASGRFIISWDIDDLKTKNVSFWFVETGSSGKGNLSVAETRLMLHSACYSSRSQQQMLHKATVMRVTISTRNWGSQWGSEPNPNHPRKIRPKSSLVISTYPAGSLFWHDRNLAKISPCNQRTGSYCLRIRE